jgi:hypothetical protein
MRPILLCVLCLSFAAHAEPVAEVSPEPAQKEPETAHLPLRARLDRDAIRAAIAATPVERDPYPRRHEADTLSIRPVEKFSKDFANARLPDCLHSEGLKNQPTFFLSGFLALPFIAVAKVRGVCR